MEKYPGEKEREMLPKICSLAKREEEIFIP